MEAATPGGTARAEDPGLSAAREAAEAVPPESVRCNGNQLLLFEKKTDHPNKLFFMTFCNNFFFQGRLDTPRNSCIIKNELHSSNTKVLCFNRRVKREVGSNPTRSRHCM